jgi:hypothetical protein
MVDVARSAVIVAGSVVGLVASAVAGAGGAAATTIIGEGNSASGNRCLNVDESNAPRGATGQTAGVVTATLAAVPFSAPANQCGDLGLPKEDKADQPEENAHVDVAE